MTPTLFRKSAFAGKLHFASFDFPKRLNPTSRESIRVLKGRKATGFWGDGVPDEIRRAGAEYVDAEVVVDGNLVTSRYPMDLPAYVREMMKLVRKIRR